MTTAEYKRAVGQTTAGEDRVAMKSQSGHTQISVTIDDVVLAVVRARAARRGVTLSDEVALMVEQRLLQSASDIDRLGTGR